MARATDPKPRRAQEHPLAHAIGRGIASLRAASAARLPDVQRGLHRTGARGLRALGRAGLAALRGLGHGIARGVAWLGQAAWARRAVVLASMLRLGWWLALAVLVQRGTALLGWHIERFDVSLALPFVLALATCGVIVLLAEHRRLRWAAIALGTAHGALALMIWTALNPTA